MSNLDVNYMILAAVASFFGPLCWYLFRENKRLRDPFDQLQFFKIASRNASDGIVIQNMEGTILWANPAYCRIQRTEISDILGRKPQEFALPDDQTPSAEDIAAFRYDSSDPQWSTLERIKNKRQDGTTIWVELSVSFYTSEENLDYAINVCRDVTEKVEREDALRDIRRKLQYEATHDGLTGVSNRAAFLSFIDDALGADQNTSVGLLHIDLDNFKTVNDTHGHSAGDAVLVNTAKIIRATIRECDLVARVGGDEFVVVCPNTPDLTFLKRISTDLLHAISTPFDWSNRFLQIEGSIGAALSAGCTITSADLLIQADFALYEAKRAGRNQVAVFDEALHARHTFETQRMADVLDAIDTGTMLYFYQPIVSLDTGAIVRMETLVRWDHPTDGLIPPDEFLPTVKEIGLIGTLDLLSMTAALTQKRALNLAGHTDIAIAFNASPELLAHPEFIKRLVWGVEAAGIDRDQVTIEVLETTNFGSADQANSHAATIADLRQAGFQVHLDDFGIGFAGLSHLATLDVTGVKIDRGLVTDLLTDTTSCKIVRKTIELCNDLGLSVTAEGVEDAQTAAALHAMGCNIIQGYYLSRALPASDLVPWLAAHTANTAVKRA